jgi:hypothetical protein
MRMTLGEAKRISGGLSFPSKMPGTAYSLPASACIAGARLAKIPGTACSKCYALKDRYTWINPTKSQHVHLAAIGNSKWIDAMVKMLLHVHRNPTFRIDIGVKNAKARGLIRHRYNQAGFHRWHDAGDLQSGEHLAAICEVARRTPKIKHWLPTQELGMVKRYVVSGGAIPDNLLIRASSIFVDDARRRAWPHTSSVFRSDPPPEAMLRTSLTNFTRWARARDGRWHVAPRKRSGYVSAGPILRSSASGSPGWWGRQNSWRRPRSA